MFRRHVLAALEAGIIANDEDGARAVVRRVDPVARVFVRRRLEKSLIDAALACDAAQLATPDGAHIMRVAALAVANQEPPAGDVDAVAAAYAQLVKPRLPGVPLASLVTVLVAAALLGSAGLYISHALDKPSRTYTRALPPPTAEAFAKGGVPLRDPAVDKLLGEPLTELVIQGGNARDGRPSRLASALGSLRAPGALRPHGVPVVTAWNAMLGVFERSVEAAKANPTQRQRDDLAEAVREVTAQLQSAGLGYFLEGRFKGGYAYVQAYRVEEVVLVTVAGAPRRVLSLRRLDKLNTAYAVLGMHTEDLDPVLHLERIDENVATSVMPVLATGVSYPLADREWLLGETGKALAAKVGEVVRREYLAALGDDAKQIDEIARLLAKRNDIVDEWRDHLARKHIYFVRAENLFLPPDLLEQLEDVTPNYQRRRVREIEDRLAELEAPRIHARIHDLVAATVRRHEAQHGFDYDRDLELRYPQQLVDFLGPPHDADGNPIAIVRSARAELSAYLSQIANDPVTPQAALWHLARQVFDRDRAGTGEYYAGIVILEGLARHLGVAVEASRRVSREALARSAGAIADAPDDKLRAAAGTLWTELYSEPVVPIVQAR